jgi:hypothetical protein
VGDSERYNEIAAKVMNDLSIPSHDIYSISRDKMKVLMRPANVLFISEGNKVLATEVAKVIMDTLGQN